MSKIEVDTIEPQSGTSLTLGASGDTITIPSGATLDGSSATLTGLASTNGITENDIWYLNSAFTGGTTFINTAWSQWNTETARLGTGMSESSGTFSFPNTGIWYIDFQAEFRAVNESRYNEAKIATTTNNSSYNDRSYGYCSLANLSATAIGVAGCSLIFDVTDTSTHKVRFGGSPVEATTQLYGSASNFIQTRAIFIRLGDT